MSYDKTIDNKLVTFGEEEDYLNCRLQYLKYCRDAVMPEVTFIQYIQNGMYPTSILVQNIVSIINNWIPTESSFAVGNDSSSFTSFTSGQDVHIQGNLVVSGEVTSGSNIVGTTIGSYGQANLNGDVYAMLSQPVPAPVFHPPYNETEAAGMNSSEIDAAFGAFTEGGLPPLSALSKESIPEKPPADLI
jgi:hypothetical protein